MLLEQVSKSSSEHKNKRGCFIASIFYNIFVFFGATFRLIVEKTTRDFSAKIQHHTGRTILECNTNEFSLAKQLYRPYDMAAYVNFGRVSVISFDVFHSIRSECKLISFCTIPQIFAQRCLEAGIIEVQNFTEASEGSKLEAFFKELEKNGLKLSESPQYKKSRPTDLHRMDKPWMIQND